MEKDKGEPKDEDVEVVEGKTIDRFIDTKTHPKRWCKHEGVGRLVTEEDFTDEIISL